MTSRFRVVPAAYVLLLRDTEAGTEVLLQLRSNTGFRDGYWAAAAAGHVEQGEPAPVAACREALEELGVTVVPDDLVPLITLHRTQNTGDPVDERVDFFFTCRRWTGEPRRSEPDKSADLRWFALDALPDPVVPHELQVLDAVRSGSVPPIATHGFAAPGDSLLG
ncbi:NUDIX hydrolase [Pseudonocardia endophytica]|uniref:ADP-ribose pyrophosphatase YjhB (NUDIX family) n=1 Tax=Pseudonocardia endophytica TaxID=401976 RepID=A0A4R1HV12_PSEEN|nr:NUDIX domain-containing protein [Pseudonocardia endophytica]TCK25251.1 ADP-ribose pyrophosphatase YjhB (NUDIX family) [Pseudonocardia endophytica]